MMKLISNKLGYTHLKKSVTILLLSTMVQLKPISHESIRPEGVLKNGAMVAIDTIPDVSQLSIPEREWIMKQIKTDIDSIISQRIEVVTPKDGAKDRNDPMPLFYYLFYENILTDYRLKANVLHRYKD